MAHGITARRAGSKQSLSERFTADPFRYNCADSPSRVQALERPGAGGYGTLNPASGGRLLLLRSTLIYAPAILLTRISALLLLVVATRLLDTPPNMACSPWSSPWASSPTPPSPTGCASRCCGWAARARSVAAACCSPPACAAHHHGDRARRLDTGGRARSCPSAGPSSPPPSGSISPSAPSPASG